MQHQNQFAITSTIAMYTLCSEHFKKPKLQQSYVQCKVTILQLQFPNFCPLEKQKHRSHLLALPHFLFVKQASALGSLKCLLIIVSPPAWKSQANTRAFQKKSEVRISYAIDASLPIRLANILKIRNLQCSPNALVVNTSRNVTMFECWIFFHMSTSTMHFVLTRRKPEKENLSHFKDFWLF